MGPGDLLNQTEQLQNQLDAFKLHTADALDTMFLLTMGALVYLMQCGFAFLEAGSIRSKAVTNILLKNFLDSSIAAIAYWSTGWAFAYGPSQSPGPGLVIGYGQFFFQDEKRLAQFFFQYVFAATAATIIGGALAERCEYTATLIFSFFIAGFVYPVCAHMIWDPNGWLYRGFTFNDQWITVLDYAGSGVVHVCGGSIALVGAVFMGPRIGRFGYDHHGRHYKNNVNPFKGHSVPLVTLGALVLGFGFLGFNGGSIGHISQDGDPETSARSMINTIIAGAFASMAQLLFGYVKDRQYHLLSTINSFLAGMVSVCACCNTAPFWGAASIGVGAAVVYRVLALIVERARIDDPLEAIGVHLGGGSWGLFAAPFFNGHGFVPMIVEAIRHSPQIRFDRCGLELAWNLLTWITIVTWCTLTMTPVFFLLKKFNVLRVSEEAELGGIDLHRHSEEAYPSSKQIVASSTDHSITVITLTNGWKQ